MIPGAQSKDQTGDIEGGGAKQAERRRTAVMLELEQGRRD